MCITELWSWGWDHELTAGNLTYLDSALESLNSSRATLAILPATGAVISTRPSFFAPITRPDSAEALDASENTAAGGCAFVALALDTIALALRQLHAGRDVLVTSAIWRSSIDTDRSMTGGEAALGAVLDEGACEAFEVAAVNVEVSAATSRQYVVLLMKSGDILTCTCWCRCYHSWPEP